MAASMLRELFRPPALKDFPGPFARRARQVAEELRDLWEQTSRNAAANRQVEDLHAARDDYRALLEGHLRLLEHYRSLTALHQSVFGADLGGTEELDRAVGELRALHDALFPRWQTLDDLYHILIDKFSLSAEKLKEYAASHPPPQSWYDETDDPFAPD